MGKSLQVRNRTARVVVETSLRRFRERQKSLSALTIQSTIYLWRQVFKARPRKAAIVSLAAANGADALVVLVIEDEFS